AAAANGADSPTAMSPMPAGRAKPAGNVPPAQATRKTTPMMRKVCNAISAGSSRRVSPPNRGLPRRRSIKNTASGNTMAAAMPTGGAPWAFNAPDTPSQIAKKNHAARRRSVRVLSPPVRGCSMVDVDCMAVPFSAVARRRNMSGQALDQATRGGMKGFRRLALRLPPRGMTGHDRRGAARGDPQAVRHIDQSRRAEPREVAADRGLFQVQPAHDLGRGRLAAELRGDEQRQL